MQKDFNLLATTHCHIFAKPQVASNKYVHIFRHCFLAQYFMPFQMVWSVLFGVLEPHKLLWFLLFKHSTNKMNSRVKGHENLCQKNGVRSCIHFFEVTFRFERCDCV